ncbi:hypothetical protein ACL655_01330 [Klebsiella quasipneumoniae subsp. similipneumoniae]
MANHVINAKRNGRKLSSATAQIETARIADMHIALKNGSNIALLNAIGRRDCEEDLPINPSRHGVPKASVSQNR